MISIRSMLASMTWSVKTSVLLRMEQELRRPNMTVDVARGRAFRRAEVFMFMADLAFVRAEVFMFMADIAFVRAEVFMFMADLAFVRAEVFMFMADIAFVRAEVFMFMADLAFVRAEVFMFMADLAFVRARFGQLRLLTRLIVLKVGWRVVGRWAIVSQDLACHVDVKILCVRGEWLVDDRSQWRYVVVVYFHIGSRA